MKRAITAKGKIRKKPCPYCQKMLQAPSKHRWRNNLARHLANTCQPFQREQIMFMTRTVCKLIEAYLPQQGLTGYTAIAAKSSEVAELDRLYKLEPPQ